MMRQFSDKTDGVAQHYLLFLFDIENACGGIESREKFILGENAGVGQPVEQC